MIRKNLDWKNDIFIFPHGHQGLFHDSVLAIDVVPAAEVHDAGNHHDEQKGDQTGPRKIFAKLCTVMLGHITEK